MIRDVEMRDDSNNWVRRNFMDVKQGDIFRFYEPDGTLIIFEELRNIIYKAAKDAYYNADGIATIEYTIKDNR